MSVLKSIQTKLLDTDFYKGVCIAVFILIPSIILTFAARYITIILVAWGGLILLNDLLNARQSLKTSYSIWLLLFIVGYCITLIFFMKNDVISTINVFIWVILEFFLFYAFNYQKTVNDILTFLSRMNLSITIIAAVCGIIGLVPFFGAFGVISPDPEGINSMWTFGVINGRNSGIFNNPIPYASSMYLGIIAATWNLLSRKFERKQTQQPLKFIDFFYGFVILLCYLNLVTTLTRALIYGFYLFCAVAAAIYTYIKVKNNLSAIRRWICALCILPIVIISMMGIDLFTKTAMVKLMRNSNVNVYVISKTPIKDEIINQYKDNNPVSLEREELKRVPSFFFPRNELWKIGLQVIPHSPILGFTSGNRNASSLEFGTTDYMKYLPKGITTYHNAYFDIAASAGLLGLGLIVVFLILCIKQTLVRILKPKYLFDKESMPFYAIMAGYIAVHVLFVCLFFGQLVFNNISTCLYFWVLLGLLMRWNQILKKEETLKGSVYGIIEKAKLMMKGTVAK